MPKLEMFEIEEREVTHLDEANFYPAGGGSGAGVFRSYQRPRREEKRHERDNHVAPQDRLDRLHGEGLTDRQRRCTQGLARRGQ